MKNFQRSVLLICAIMILARAEVVQQDHPLQMKVCLFVALVVLMYRESTA